MAAATLHRADGTVLDMPHVLRVCPQSVTYLEAGSSIVRVPCDFGHDWLVYVSDDVPPAADEPSPQTSYTQGHRRRPGHHR